MIQVRAATAETRIVPPRSAHQPGVSPRNRNTQTGFSTGSMSEISTVLTAVFYFGLSVACMLSAPAVWEGNTIMGTLARVYAIARNRGFEGLVMLILLSILCGLVAMLVFAGFGAGYAMTLSMAGSILKQGIGGGGIGKRPPISDEREHERQHTQRHQRPLQPPQPTPRALHHRQSIRVLRSAHRVARHGRGC